MKIQDILRALARRRGEIVTRTDERRPEVSTRLRAICAEELGRVVGRQSDRAARRVRQLPMSDQRP